MSKINSDYSDLVLVKNTDDLDSLNKNFDDFNSQSYNYRKMADDQSVALYGDDNYNRYEKIKSNILNNEEPKEKVIGSLSNLEESDYDVNDVLYNYKEKTENAKNAEKDYGVKLAFLPIEDLTYDDIDVALTKLNNKYEEYNSQSEDQRSIADDYAYSLFNMDNHNLYFSLKQKILEDKEGKVLNKSDDKSDIVKYEENMKYEIDKYPFDVILTESKKMDIENIQKIEDKVKTKEYFNSALSTNYSEEIPTIVPNLFPDELLDLGILNMDNFYKVNTDTDEDNFLSEYFHGIFMDPYKYKHLVENYYRRLNEDYDTYYQKLLELAWNPEVEPNMDNYKKARENMIEYINTKLENVNIVNLSRYNIKENIIQETSKFDDELFPVFIVCSFTYTFFGNVVRKVTNDYYSHASIAFDSDLKTLYSFNMNTAKKHGGLSFESIDGYLNDSNEAEIFVGCVLLNSHDYKRIRSNLNWYIANYDKCNYSISDLFLILANKAKSKKYQLNMVCSQFVDNLFKLVNIDIVSKPSNLVRPQDLRNASNNNTVFILYDGLARNYDMKKVDKKVYSLIKKQKRLNESTDIYYNIENNIFQEGFMFNKDNLYINFDDFKNGKSNIVLVTGLSGSGKSTLGKSLASEYKAEWIELDMFEHCYAFENDKQLKQCGQVFYDYLTSHKKIWEDLKSKKITGDELCKEIYKFLKYCISWCKKDNKKKYVIEGVQIYSVLEKQDIGRIPIIFVNTSALSSMIRRIKRTREEDKTYKSSEIIKDIPKVLSWYINDNRSFEKFKKAVLNESTIIEEKTLPISIDDNFIIIDTPKDIENEYQKSHKLLIEYDKSNSLEPMKHELSKLWYLNILIEKKVQNPKCKDKTKLMNLRSRILNDFKKYIKVILKEEPEFNFDSYYNQSEYSDTNLKMDRKTTLELIEILKQIIKR